MYLFVSPTSSPVMSAYLPVRLDDLDHCHSTSSAAYGGACLGTYVLVGVFNTACWRRQTHQQTGCQPRLRRPPLSQSIPGAADDGNSIPVVAVSSSLVTSTATFLYRRLAHRLRPPPPTCTCSS